MVIRRKRAGGGGRLARVGVAIAVSLVLSASGAHAQAGGVSEAVQSGSGVPPGSGLVARGGGPDARPTPSATSRLMAAALTPAPVTGIRRAIRTVDYAGIAVVQRKVAAAHASTARRQRSIGRKVLGGVIGAVGGFFAGGFLGAAIEGDGCHCDDPGLKGFLIGAPVGAVTGGILGATLF